MGPRSKLVIVALGAMLAAPLFVAPAAWAHCDNIDGAIGVVPKCLLNEAIEDRIKQLNDLGGGEWAFVMVKDTQFHPENVTIKNGGTVIWVWLDAFSNQVHDPRSSVSCDGTRQSALLQCMPNTPERWGECFDVLRDKLSFMGDTNTKNFYYPVTFKVDTPAAPLQKSHGVLSGTLPLPYSDSPNSFPFPQTFQTCTQDTAAYDGGVVTVPYHCGIHGTPTLPFKMRGSITIIP